MSAYQDYIDELRRLLHDVNDVMYPLADKLTYINDGRNRTVRDTGCYRLLQAPLYLSPNVEVFNFGGVTGVNITNQGAGYAPGTYALGVGAVAGAIAATGTYTV